MAEITPEMIGSPVRVLADNCPREWREDWRDWSGFLAGVHYEPRVGLNFTVSDKWPPESNGDLSDGFREGQLAMQSASVSDGAVERGAFALCDLMGGNWADHGDRALFRLRASAVLDAALSTKERS